MQIDTKKWIIPILFLLSSIPGLTWAQWTPYGLEARSIEELTTAGDWLYVATDSGLFRKHLDQPDEEWNLLAFSDQRVYAVGSQGTDTLLVAIDTGTEQQSETSLYRSIDDGESFEQVGTETTEGATLVVGALDHYPGRPGTFLTTGSSVILKSEQAGSDWRTVYGSLDGFGMGVHFLSFDPNRPEVIWSGGESGILQPFVLKSTDGGESWVQFAPDLGGDNAIYAAAPSRTDTSVVFAGAEGSVIKSTDGGISWEQILSPEEYPYFYGVETTPLHPERVYAAGWRRVEQQDLIVYISTDSGATWTDWSYGEAGDYGVVAMARVTVDGDDHLFLGTNGEGVFRFIVPQSVASEPDPDGLPNRFALEQNYPNPFNPQTKIAFTLPHAESVTLVVFDILGREVDHLASGRLSAGRHEVHWDAAGFPAGVYLYRLQAGSFMETRKLTLLE